jgi:hypothetical protein
MASGYEKAECGGKEGGGWGEPSRLGSALMLILALGAAVWHYLPLVWAIWSLFSGAGGTP